jgi:hypothetical protein
MALLLAWTLTLSLRGEWALAMMAIPLLALVAWAAAWRPEPGGRLFEQGGRWCFEDPARGLAPQPGSLVVALDLGPWMLLSFRHDGPRLAADQRWIVLSGRDMPADWGAFRRAVYSPRPVPAGLAAQAPADPPA